MSASLDGARARPSGYIAFIMWFLPLVACVVHYPQGGAGAPVAAAAVPSPELIALEAQVDQMVGASTEIDSRDRLEAIWELVHGVRNQPAEAQRLVLDTARKLVAIEQRNIVVATDTLGAPTSEGEQTFTPVGAGVKEESIDGQ